MTTAQEKVAAGVAVLDQKVPGWWKAIKLDTLEMADCHHCMLGQLFGYDVEVAVGTRMFGLSTEEPTCPVERLSSSGYWRGLRTLHKLGVRVDGEDIGCNSIDADEYDEETDSYDNSGSVKFDDLKCAWAEVIAERRASEEMKSTPDNPTQLNNQETASE